MALFLSTHINKIDRKGRVSVPAQFRAALAAQNFAGIVAYRSFQAPIIEAGGIDRMKKFAEELETLESGGDRARFIGAILADARQLGFDSEGRIMLPLDLAAHAGIGEEIAFIGQGHFFVLREPGSAKADVEQAFTAGRTSSPKFISASQISS